MPGLQPILTDFLSGLDVYNHNADYLQSNDKHFGEVRTATKHNLGEHPQFPPSINRENFEANVKLLMDARESAIDQKAPLYFSDGTARRHNKNDPLIPEEDVVAFHSKTEDEKREEAEKIADLLANRLPKRLHDRVYQFIDMYFVRRRRFKKHYYYSSMKRSCNFHTHLILKELAEYLYIPLPKFIDETFLAEGWRDWNAIRDEMSLVFYQAQHKFALSYRAAAADHSDRKQVVGGASVLQMTQELGSIRRQANGAPQERERGVNRGAAPTKVHVKYNAVLLSREGLAEIEEKYKQETSRQLFIDNLPIDIDEEELIDIYSRCGDIESVRIFNRRPDLDPGNPIKELKKQISRGIMMEKTTRTPIYAIVKFATDEGYDTATGADLRVFGIIIQRHAVRSIKKEEMKSLFIENIPRGFFALDLEYKLCKVLDPYFYVCSGTGGHDLAEPSSCKITFPSHEAACFAYDKLVEIDMGSDDCVMNWMRTPRDAMNYWTRRKVGAAK